MPERAYARPELRHMRNVFPSSLRADSLAPNQQEDQHQSGLVQNQGGLHQPPSEQVQAPRAASLARTLTPLFPIACAGSS